MFILGCCSVVRSLFTWWTWGSYGPILEHFLFGVPEGGTKQPFLAQKCKKNFVPSLWTPKKSEGEGLEFPEFILGACSLWAVVQLFSACSVQLFSACSVELLFSACSVQLFSACSVQLFSACSVHLLFSACSVRLLFSACSLWVVVQCLFCWVVQRLFCLELCSECSLSVVVVVVVLVL